MASKKDKKEKAEKISKPIAAENKAMMKFEDELSKLLSTQVGIEVTSLSEADFVPYWIDTGNFALNWICSHSFKKGLPGTKIIMIEGENSKGKSLLGAKILGENVRNGGISWYIDTEDAANYNFVKQIVGDPQIADRIRRNDQIETIEQLNKAMFKIADFQIAKGGENRFCVLIDSFSQLTSEKEMRTADEKYKGGKDEPRDMTKSQKAREGLRVITRKLAAANLTPIYIVHLTKAIGVMFGDPNVPATHGNMLLYSASLRLSITSSRDIVDPKYPIPVGVSMNIKTNKNRSVHKGKKCTIDFYFTKGVDRFSGLAQLLKDYGIVDGAAKVEPSSKLKYDDFEFKASEISKVVEKFSEAGRDLLQEWEDKLSDIVEFKEKDLPESDFISSEDGIEDGLTEIYDEDKA